MSRARLRTIAVPALLCLALTATACSTTPTPAAKSDPATYETAKSDATQSDSAKSGTSPTSPPTSQGETPASPSGPAAAAPVEVSIPSISVTSALMRLGLNPDGTVEVPPPEKGMTAGWYTGAAVPGEPGPSVIIGHNDTKFGRAVFHDLKKIGKGADITVRNDKGAIARFTVTGTETVSKKAFPTQRVYGPTNGRELRLITCDGEFDAAGHPVDNLIVYAKLA
ncbi:class F sortase [Streptomyces sp. NPDC020965]|uniref:class F sortase n=1 Tax=Streptomyces sp. NPDC020965 TaxID=3365105 RepID=UPI00378C9CD3